MNKERLMAILMLVFFAVAWTAIIYGMVIKSEGLILSGFVVFVLVFIYSRIAKKRIDVQREEERLRRAQEEEENEQEQ